MGFDTGGGGGGAPTDAQYVVTKTNAALSDERTLSAGDDLGLSDGGAGGTATLNVADSATFNSITTDSLVIGNKLFEEDGNSPIDVTNTGSVTYTVDGTWDQLIILPGAGIGFDELQVNGDTKSNYDVLDNADAQTTGQNQWSPLPLDGAASRYELNGRDSGRIKLNVGLGGKRTGKVIGGENNDVSPPITQFTFNHSSSSSQDLKARVYGRAI